MRHARLLLLLLLSTGCSVFFDPTKIPCSPATCLQLANTSASCVMNTCVYTCATGYADMNGDLNATASNGCEAPCAGAASLLHAVVGTPSGGINWVWDPSDAGPAKGYQLCTGTQPTQLTNCTGVDASYACSRPMDGFACSATVRGLANNVRVYGRLQTVDQCGTISPDTTAPTRSATPINGELLTLTDVSTLNSCDAGINLDGGVLRFNQTGLCLAGVLFGDDQWTNFTLRAEAKLPGTSGGFSAGLAFHYPATTPARRSSFLVNNEASDTAEFGAAFTVLPPGDALDRTTATTIAPAARNQWLGLEITAVDGGIAAAMGPLGTPLPQVLRWREPPGGGGRVGMYLVTPLFAGEESVEFRNLTLSTRATLPDAGTGSHKLDFKTSSLPAEMRIVQPGGVTMKTCNPFLAGAGCLGGAACTPDPGSNCIEIQQLGLSRAAAAFDMPLGLDTTRPWRVSLKFATSALGADAQILRSRSGPGSILRGPPGSTMTWNGTLSSFNVDTGRSIQTLTWNRFDYTFDGTSYSLKINNTAVTTVPPLFPPTAQWDPHLGALMIGGKDVFTGSAHAWWTDIEFAQPP